MTFDTWPAGFDTEKQTVKLEGGEELGFDFLLACDGAHSDVGGRQCHGREIASGATAARRRTHTHTCPVADRDRDREREPVSARGHVPEGAGEFGGARALSPFTSLRSAALLFGHDASALARHRRLKSSSVEGIVG